MKNKLVIIGFLFSMSFLCLAGDKAGNGTNDEFQLIFYNCFIEEFNFHGCSVVRKFLEYCETTGTRVNDDNFYKFLISNKIVF